MFRWLDHIVVGFRKAGQDSSAVDPVYLFPGDETPSAAADQLIDGLRALHEQIKRKYGEEQIELPYEEWVVWRTLMARVQELPLPEQRYLWRRLSGEQ